MVHAIDVSEAMIRWAARNVEAGQVKFHATDGIEIPLPNDSVDAVFSVHVFQHLDSKADAAAYVAEIGRVLAPGGTVMLHFPILILPGRGAARRIVRAVLRIREYLGGVRAKLARGLLRIGIGKPIMRMLAYEDGWVFSEFSRASLESVELRVFRVRSNQQLHSFFLARKTIRPNRPGGDGV